MSQKAARGGAGRGKAPPKGKKPQAGRKKVEDEREETLQAVVCATRFCRHGEVLMLGRYWQIRSRRDSVLLHWRFQE
jgi:hypothetical protein